MDCIVIMYSEIGLKGANRKQFEERLITNIERATGLERKRFMRRYGRILIRDVNESERARIHTALNNVFGVHRHADVRIVPCALDNIADEVLRRIEAHGMSARSFCVRARRSDKSLPTSSQEVNEYVGGKVLEAHPHVTVDLEHPELTCFVEIRPEETYVYTSLDMLSGPGGLPVGAVGAGLALVSGGIDSPVATWMCMKRGLTMNGIYFHSAPYTSAHAKEKVFDLARKLSVWNGGEICMHVVAFGEIQKHIADHAPEELWTVLFRRSMRRISDMTARQNKRSVVCTGDNIGQVASQTPDNLGIIDESGTLPIVRPVVGFDKQEIIDRARHIGTYDISIRPHEDCCTVFTPRNPATKARHSDVHDTEARLDLSEMEQRVCEGIETFSITPEKVEKIT